MQIINATSGTVYPPCYSTQYNGISGVSKTYAYFTYIGYSETLLGLPVTPGDVRFMLAQNPASSMTAGEVYIATSTEAPNGTAQDLTIMTKANLMALTSIGVKGKSGAWSNQLVSGKHCWIGCRFDIAEDSVNIKSHRDEATLSTAMWEATSALTVGNTYAIENSLFSPCFWYVS